VIARLVLVAGVIAAAAGVALWQAEDAALAGGLLAGAGVALAAAGLSASLTRSGPGTLAVGDLAGERGFVFVHSVGKQALSAVLVGIVTVVLVAFAADGVWWLWIVAAFFALRLVLFLVRGGAQVRFGVTPTGVVAAPRRIAWDAVRDVEVIDPLKRGRIKLVRVHGDGRPMVVDPAALISGPDAIAHVVRVYLDEPERRAQIGTEAELARIAAWRPESPTRT
jgi:hypothetical protein